MSFQVDKTARIYEPVYFVKAKHDIIIGKYCSIGQFCFIAARKLRMEDYAEICPQVTIGGGGDVNIGYGATIAYGARIIPATFLSSGKFMNDNVDQKHTDMIRGCICIEEGAYIGSNATICVSIRNPHIHIGKYAVVGANSYIDKDVKPGVITHPKIKQQIEKRREFDLLGFLKGTAVPKKCKWSDAL